MSPTTVVRGGHVLTMGPAGDLTGGAVAFAETGDAFETVRYTLARAIARAPRDDSPRPRHSRGKRRGH